MFEENATKTEEIKARIEELYTDLAYLQDADPDDAHEEEDEDDWSEFSAYVAAQWEKKRLHEVDDAIESAELELLQRVHRVSTTNFVRARFFYNFSARAPFFPEKL